MEMMRGMFNRGGIVKISCFLAALFLLPVLSGCNEAKDDDMIIGDQFYYMFPTSFRPLVGVEGGRKVVPVNEELRNARFRFILGTVHEFDGFSHIVEEFESGESSNFLWLSAYDPLYIEFHSTDIVNIRTGSYDRYWSKVTDDMLAAGVEVIENATEFEYQWINVKVNAGEVLIDAAPNQTGASRHIILLFGCDEPCLLNNMIEVRQRGE